MKSYKLFIESIIEPKYDEDHKYELVRNIIIKDNKTINGFKIDYDDEVGTIGWYNEDYQILATPYWDGYKKLPINISISNSGVEIDQRIFSLREINNINDVNLTIKSYYNRIDQITNELNKRSKLKKDLNIISKYNNEITVPVNGIFIRDYMDLNKINLDVVPLSDIISISDNLSKKYSHILLSDKFNV